MRLYKLLFFTVLFVGIIDSFAQTNRDQYYIWFDAHVNPENTGLSNGMRYKEIYRIRNEKHKFYESAEFQKGNIRYFDQPYYNVDIKYDIFEDRLIVKFEGETGSVSLQLINAKVDDFQLNNKNFINLKQGTSFNNVYNLPGFYELLHRGQYLELFLKHKKTRKVFLEKSVVYSEFKSENKYFIKKENVYYQFKKKGDIIGLFPELKKLINAHYNGNKLLLKSNYQDFIIQLLNKIEAENQNLKSLN